MPSMELLMATIDIRVTSKVGWHGGSCEERGQVLDSLTAPVRLATACHSQVVPVVAERPRIREALNLISFRVRSGNAQGGLRVKLKYEGLAMGDCEKFLERMATSSE
jgi:hypothetical protein